MAAGGRRRAALQRRRGDPARPSASPAAPPSAACSDALRSCLPLPRWHADLSAPPAWHAKLYLSFSAEATLGRASPSSA